MIKEPAQPIDDGKTEPHGAALSPFRFGNLIELVEDFLLLMLRNSGAAVPYLDVQPAAATTAADDNPSARRVAHRVGHDIEQDAFQQNNVAPYPGAARHHSQSQALLMCSARKRRLEPLQQMADRKLREAGDEHTGIELGNVQKCIEQ